MRFSAHSVLSPIRAFPPCHLPRLLALFALSHPKQRVMFCFSPPRRYAEPKKAVAANVQKQRELLASVVEGAARFAAEYDAPGYKARLSALHEDLRDVVQVRAPAFAFAHCRAYPLIPSRFACPAPQHSPCFPKTHFRNPMSLTPP